MDTGQVRAAAGDDAGAVARAIAAVHSDFEGRVEVGRNPLQITFGGRAQQPHQQEESHHRRHKVGVRNLPSTTMRAMVAFFDALDDDGLQLLVAGCSGWCATGCVWRRHRLLSLDVLFELQETRALGGIQHLAAKFDGCWRVVALHAGNQGALDALKLFSTVLLARLNQSRQRLHQGIGQQNTQERTDQCRGNHAAQHGGRLAHRPHGVHHTQHRSHNTEGRQGTRQALQCHHHPVVFLVVGFHLVVHQGLDLMGVQIARHHHAQIVGDELHQMLVRQQLWILLEDLRVVRLFHIHFDGHQTFFAGFLQQVIQQSQQAHKARFGVFGAFERRWNGLDRGFEHLGLVTHDECANRRTTNGGHFKGECFGQYAHVSAMQGVDTENAAKGDDVTNKDKHVADCGSVTRC